MSGITRIFRLEVTRVFRSRRYWYLLLVSLLMMAYSLSLWNGGLSGTAPFAAPSIGKLFSLNGSIWACAEILLCRELHGEKELAARRILLSAPVSTARYFVPKLAAVLAAVLTIVLAFFLSTAGCFHVVFGVLPLTAMLEAFLIFSLPSLLFTAGLSMLLGRIHGSVLYALCTIVFLVGMLNLPFPLWADLFGNWLYVDIGFIISLRAYVGQALILFLPGEFLWGRAAFAVLGLAGIGFGCVRRLPG